MPFLGMIISNAGVQPDPSRILSIEQFPTPTSTKTLQSFLGTVNYNRPFQIRTTELTEELYKISAKFKTKFFDQQTQLRVEELCQQIRDTACQSILLENLPADINKVNWVVYTDASDIGLAGAVGWNIENTFHILGLHSRVFNSLERQYTVPRKELLAMVETILKYEYILRYVHFTAFTDNKSLSHDTGIKNEQSRPEYNWWSKLSEFEFTRVHIPGTENILSDNLSRNFKSSLIEEASNFNTPINNTLYVKSTSLALQSITRDQYDAIISAHNEGHWGPSIVASILDNKNKKWSHRKEMIKEICNKCAICRVYNPGIRYYFSPRSIYSDLPMLYLEMDIAGPMKVDEEDKLVFLVIDIFSSFCWLFPIDDKSSNTIISCLNRICSSHGLPNVIQSDNAKEFISKEMSSWLKKHSIQMNNSSEYSQRSNGRVERHVGIMKQLLKKLILECKATAEDWIPLLEHTQYAINNRPLQGINVSPFQILNGRLFKHDITKYDPTALPVHSWNTRINNLQNEWYKFINNWHKKRIESTNRDFVNRHKIDDTPIPIDSLAFFKEQGAHTSWNTNYWTGPVYITSINENLSFKVNLCNDPPNNPLERTFPRDQLHIIETASLLPIENPLDPIEYIIPNDTNTSNAMNPDWIIALIAARLNNFAPQPDEYSTDDDNDNDNIDFNHYDIMFQWTDKTDNIVKCSWIHSSKLPESALTEFFNPINSTDDVSFYCHYTPFFK